MSFSASANSRPKQGRKTAKARVVKTKSSRKPWTLQTRSKLLLRFHIITDALRARLTPAAARNVKATGAYMGTGDRPLATMFLVSALRPNGTALVLTNAHVTEGGKKGRVEFSTGSKKVISAKIIRTVATSSATDSSLVLVKFSRLVWLSRRLTPIKIADKPLAAREKVYTTGFPKLDPRLSRFEDIVSAHFGSTVAPPGVVTAKDKESGGLDSDREQITLLRRELSKGQQSIHMGFDNTPMSVSTKNAEIQIKAFNGVNGVRTVAAYSFSLPNSPGSSGSPIFSAATDRLVALHNAGNPAYDSRETIAIPIQRVLRGLKVDYLGKDNKSVSKSVNAMVAGFLKF